MEKCAMVLCHAPAIVKHVLLELAYKIPLACVMLLCLAQVAYIVIQQVNVKNLETVQIRVALLIVLMEKFAVE